MNRLLATLVVFACASACSQMTRAYKTHGVKEEMTTQNWAAEIQAKAQSGDWMVVRGYHFSDDLVVLGTRSGVSHVAIYDQDTNEAVEAISPVVRAIPLQEFVGNSHRIILIRPTGIDLEKGRAAVTKARTKLGLKYDFLGTIGLPSQSQFYCSELAVWSVGIEVDDAGQHQVVPPKDMHLYGTIILDTGARE